MPNILVVIPTDIWPFPSGRLHATGSLADLAPTIPEGEAGWIEGNLQTAEQINTNIQLQLPENSFLVYSDSAGRFRVGIVDEFATYWFLTQRIAIGVQHALINLFCTYENGVFTARINNDVLLLDEEADGQVYTVLSLYKPNSYTLGPTTSFFFFAKAPNSSKSLTAEQFYRWWPSN